jgi:hypothetical protein
VTLQNAPRPAWLLRTYYVGRHAYQRATTAMLACPVISLINWRRPQGVTVHCCLLRSRRAAQSDLDSHAHQSTRNSAAGELTRPLPLESVPQKIGAPEMKDLRSGAATRQNAVASRPAAGGVCVDGWRPAETEGNTSGGHYATATGGRGTPASPARARAPSRDN